MMCFGDVGASLRAPYHRFCKRSSGGVKMKLKHGIAAVAGLTLVALATWVYAGCPLCW